MPYISKENKEVLKECLESLAGRLDDFSSDFFPSTLNYIIYYLIKARIREWELSYKLINDIIGALECCKQEFYRRIVIPYEDKKIRENGDIN